MSRILPSRRMSDTAAFGAWRWQDILGPDGALYLRKLYLVRTPLFQVSIHWIKRPDPGRDLHDHPRDFVSLLLRGSYVEERPAAPTTCTGSPRPLWTRRGNGSWQLNTAATVRRSPSFAYRCAEDLHRIAMVTPSTVSFVVWGPRRRPWGFQTPYGWIHWRTYTKELT